MVKPEFYVSKKFLDAGTGSRTYTGTGCHIEREPNKSYIVVDNISGMIMYRTWDPKAAEHFQEHHLEALGSFF